MKAVRVISAGISLTAFDKTITPLLLSKRPGSSRHLCERKVYHRHCGLHAPTGNRHFSTNSPPRSKSTILLAENLT